MGRINLIKTMKDRIKAIIEDNLAIDFTIINEDGNLYDDLGFDSLDHVEILMYMEREYDISINDDEAAGWQAIDDIVKTCEDCIKAKE